MKVDLDGSVKILHADKLRVEGPKDADPIDFAADTIVILCPLTSRALAVCKPIAPKATRQQKQKPNPAPTQPSQPQYRPTETPKAAPEPMVGRLSDAQIERLERMWREHPNWSDGKMGEEFGELSGREISPITAGKYRPANLPART